MGGIPERGVRRTTWQAQQREARTRIAIRQPAFLASGLRGNDVLGVLQRLTSNPLSPGGQGVMEWGPILKPLALAARHKG